MASKRRRQYVSFSVFGSPRCISSGLLPNASGLDPDRFGVVVGSGIGGLAMMEQEARVLAEKGPRRVSPFLIPAMIAVSAPCLTGIRSSCLSEVRGSQRTGAALFSVFPEIVLTLLGIEVKYIRSLVSAHVWTYVDRFLVFAIVVQQAFRKGDLHRAN